MAQPLPGTLQENLLTLLCFDNDQFRIIRDALETPNLFSSPQYRMVVERVFGFIDQYNKPPQDHLVDLLQDVLKGTGNEAKLYSNIMDAAYALRQTINPTFVMNQLGSFVRQQRLSIGVGRMAEHIQAGELDHAENVASEILRTQLTLFSPGMSLEDSLNMQTEARQDVVKLGIKELDFWDLGPARGELMVFIAPPKRGKTWFLVHVGKRALQRRLNVLYITLEIAERLVAQRFLQSIFSITRRKARVNVTRISADGLGRLTKLEREAMGKRLSFDDASTMSAVRTKLASLHTKGNLIVKAFPTGTLTVAGLRSYLDSLERSAKFVPDMIIVDYPDLMKIDAKNIRADTGVIYKDLRGIMVERNVIGVVATQSNREGAKARMVTSEHSSEDYSKIATADTVLTYSQTQAEREVGLARLFASNTRVGDRDRFVILLSQAYPVGQFCLESASMTDTYNDHLSGLLGRPVLPEGEEDC